MDEMGKEKQKGNLMKQNLNQTQTRLISLYAATTQRGRSRKRSKTLNNYMRRPERIAAVSFTSFPTHVVKREREPRKQIKARRIISKENIARK